MTESAFIDVFFRIVALYLRNRGTIELPAFQSDDSHFVGRHPGVILQSSVAETIESLSIPPELFNLYRDSVTLAKYLCSCISAL